MKYQVSTGFAEMGKHIPVAVGELRRNPLGYSNAWEQVEGVLATRGMQERHPEGGCWEGTTLEVLMIFHRYCHFSFICSFSLWISTYLHSSLHTTIKKFLSNINLIILLSLKWFDSVLLKEEFSVQAYLRDIGSSVPDHCIKTNIIIK